VHILSYEYLSTGLTVNFYQPDNGRYSKLQLSILTGKYYQSILSLFYHCFWNGLGLVLVTIYRSFISKIYAIYLLRYMAYIWLINQC